MAEETVVCQRRMVVAAAATIMTEMHSLAKNELGQTKAKLSHSDLLISKLPPEDGDQT